MPDQRLPPSASGTLLVLASAAAFGTLAIFAKLGYGAGLSPQQLLTSRFVIAGAGMLVVAFAAGQNPFRLPRGKLLALLGMGGIGYFAQSSTFFFALRSLPASEVALLLYTYPALVALAGRVFFGRRIRPLHLAALAGSFVGVLLLVGGVRLVSGPALLLAMAPPVIYATYILVGDRVMPGVPPLGAGALTISGAAVTWTVLAAATGTLRPPEGGTQWAVVLGLALIPTMFSITAFLAALPRIGASRAALLSTLEPAVTVLLAVALLGDRFSPVQAIGGALVFASVVLLQWPEGRPSVAEAPVR